MLTKGRTLNPRGKYVSKACEECRRRRRKCDGKQPACSQCVDNLRQCRYAAIEDGRNPAPKSYVQLLRNRVEILEQVLRSNHLDVDEALAQCSSSEGPSPDTTHLTESPKGVWDGTGFEGALCSDEARNFDQDSEARYFGPSSGRLDFDTFGMSTSHSHKNDWALSSTSIEEPITPSPPARFNRFLNQLEDDRVVSKEVEDHLMALYFNWEEPWCQVVDERLFKHSRQHGGRFFSPLLLNSILALGSRYSDLSHLRTDASDPNTAGALFLEKAEILLHYDMKWPSVTTIQSLILMSNAYIGSGADAAGWLHLGMANRLAIDMGLNIAPADLSSPSCMPHVEKQLKRRIYLSLYVLDKFSASYTGRICTILQSQGSLQMPAPSSPAMSSFSPVHDSQMRQFNHHGLDAMQQALVTHGKILERILSYFYAPNYTEHRRQPANFVENCLLELRNWFYDLPADLRLHRSNIRPPQVYVLHMIYQTSFILLMKPFLCKLRKPKVPGGTDTKRSEDMSSMNLKATSICRKAAETIVTVAKRYRLEIGGFRKSPLAVTYSILSAALILLQVPDLGPDHSSAENSNAIKECLSVLCELSVAWNPAQRYHQTLSRIWQGKQQQSSGQKPSPLAWPDSLTANIGYSSTSTTTERQELPPDHDLLTTLDSMDPFAGLIPTTPSFGQPQDDVLPADFSGTDWMLTEPSGQPQWVTVDICPLFGSLPEDYGDYESWNAPLWPDS